MARQINIPDEPVQLYEVIRIIGGIPLFLEDHLNRLYHSARLTGMNQLPDYGLLTDLCRNFPDVQKRETGNIKLNLIFSANFSEPKYELSFIPHHYPDPEAYLNGVKVGLLNADRPFPNAKMQHTQIRNLADRLMEANHLFEVLLIDSAGEITEGSRSNVFFIKGETLYTAHREKILQGITWMKILQICKNEKIRVMETAIPTGDLDQFEGAFLTGTSPKVLPVSSVEKIAYRTDLPLLVRLQQRYDQMIADYLKERR